MEEKDKYANDKYDREKYIPKGYILPDGTMLTKQYARFHEDMAKKFIEENYSTNFKNDIITDYKDYMILRLHALQVLSCGKPIIIYSEDNNSRIIQEAIASYVSFGWKQDVVENPYKSYFDYLHYRALNSDYYLEKKLKQSNEKPNEPQK